MTRITHNGDRVELFVPLAKFDQRTGEFEAWATVEELDRHGEICDVEKSWPAIVSMAEQQSEISQGKSVGNLRRQHRRDTSIGKLTLIERRERDGKDAVFIAGKCTDEQAKADAAEGVLTGVSLRGLAKRWPDEQIKGAKRYAWTLVEEQSMVDRPAVPHALIEVMKSSGEVEMVKAVGRDVNQYWDCLQIGCQSKHSRKEEAQKCETPEGEESLPTRIVATTKSEASSIDVDVLLEKCLGCAASVGYLIQQVTTERAPRRCSHPATDACGHYCYDDPGHEEMEAGVKQLWDALRAMVNDLRSKWMKEEGVADDAGVDVGKMLDAITSGLTASHEVIKSLRVPTGNGSKNNPKEGTMEDTKGQQAPLTNSGEGTGDGELAKSVAVLESKVADILKRLDNPAESTELAKSLGSLNDQLTAIVARIDEVAKPSPEVAEMKKELGELGETVKALSEEVAKMFGSLPVARKGALRPVEKTADTSGEGESEKGEKPTGNPFVDLVERVL